MTMLTIVRASVAVFLVLAAAWSAAATESREERMARVDRDRLMMEGKLAEDLIPPDRFDDLRTLLPQLHSVARAVVADISYDYLDCEGPRTVVTLKNVETLLGGELGRELQLRIFGGPLPNGTYVDASELPSFVQGVTYILLLRNTDWRFAPLIGDMAFREEKIFGRQVLIDSAGFAVTAVERSGIERHSEQIMEAAGRDIVGVEGSREIMQEDDGKGGDIRACVSERPCRAESKENGKELEAFATKDPTNRFAQPKVLERTGAEQIRAAISTDQLVEGLKRYANEMGVRLGGKFQPEMRLGCWNTTITDPWR